jgi:hypothetical protein
MEAVDSIKLVKYLTDQISHKVRLFNLEFEYDTELPCVVRILVTKEQGLTDKHKYISIVIQRVSDDKILYTDVMTDYNTQTYAAACNEILAKFARNAWYIRPYGFVKTITRRVKK